ncbi:HNH endonuclease [Oryzobacter faecalis]|uniref:HNH endonuclease n=1 Tax=Oryzobacter faecalis TaxID=3388656 RepID=UPI00398CBED6
MAWLRNGDNAATHPLVMALATVRDADDRLQNEAFGWVQRCAMQSAGHMTDGLIDLGTMQLLAPTRWEPLLAAAVEAGLLIPRAKGRKPTWAIPPDADFIHIRPRAEIEWERQRKRDIANPDLVVPVRERDGDGCRYCGAIVNWRQRKGPRRGTYDHREPGKAATVDTLVVACFQCNSERSNDPRADERKPLRPAPLHPFYGADTVELLARHGRIVQPSDPSARPATQADTAPAQPAEQPGPRAPARPASAGEAAPPEWARPATQADTAPAQPAEQPGPRAPARPASAGEAAPPEWARPATQADTAPAQPAEQPGPRAPARPASAGESAPPREDLQIPADPSRSEVYGPGRVGTGRGGPVRGRPGLDGDGSGSPPGRSGRARGRRGRRGKGGGR